MIYDKTCGNVRLEVYDRAGQHPVAKVSLDELHPENATQEIFDFTLEDLRDLRYLIDRALEAGK